MVGLLETHHKWTTGLVWRPKTGRWPFINTWLWNFCLIQSPRAGFTSSPVWTKAKTIFELRKVISKTDESVTPRHEAQRTNRRNRWFWNIIFQSQPWKKEISNLFSADRQGKVIRSRLVNCSSYARYVILFFIDYKSIISMLLFPSITAWTSRTCCALPLL